MTNAVAAIDNPVATFGAFDRASGAAITVDVRTFDEQLHSRTPLE